MKSGVIAISAMLILSAFVIAMDTTGATDPHLEGYKSIAPGSIFAEGKGSPDKATIDITVQGAGDPFLKSFPQDVVFVIDSSGSMRTRDPNDERMEAAKYYVDQLDGSIDERAAVVDFDSDAFLVPESNPFGDHLSTEYPRIKDNIDKIDSDGNTNIPAGMLIANEELINYGWKGNTWNAILLTDGRNAPETLDVEMDDPDDPVVKDAIDNGIKYYTVGLGDQVNAMLLMNLANMTGGSYHSAATPDELQQIYDDIHEEVVNTAAKSVTVTQTLKPEFEYVSGSFSVAPTSLVGNAATWEIPSLSIGEYWGVAFDVSSETCGYQMHVDEETTVTYTAFDGSTQNLTLPSVKVDVVGCNQAPVADCGGPYYGDEGSTIVLNASSSYDPDEPSGGYIVSYEWDIDGDGQFENATGMTLAFASGDNGFANVTLRVTDQSGKSSTDVCLVQFRNVAPLVDALSPVTIDEGQSATFFGHATDPGSDDLTFDWSWEYMGSCDITTSYLNNPPSPDPYPSPEPNPRNESESSSCLYSDNGVYVVTLIVSDDDGGSTSVNTTVTVYNLEPAITSNVTAYVNADATLRVAGEKWHDVTMQLFEDGVEVGSVSVVRYPGSPDDQSASITGLVLDMTNEYSATLVYTPPDDPVNGQLNGANPAWVILTFEGGSEKRIHHTFNVQHPETWEWNVGLNSYLVGTDITFESAANDPGSDDLFFEWEWNDGNIEAHVYYSDGSNPDPYPSPWGMFPFSASDVASHAFATAGIYTIELTIKDDDGGAVTYSITIDLS